MCTKHLLKELLAFIYLARYTISSSTIPSARVGVEWMRNRDDIGGRAAKDVRSMKIVQNAQEIAGFNSQSVLASSNSSLHHILETLVVPDCVRS